MWCRKAAQMVEDIRFVFYDFGGIPLRKLSCPTERDHFKRKLVFQPSFFRGYVSLWWYTNLKFNIDTQIKSP